MRTLKVKVAPLSDPALAGKAKVVKEGTTRRYHTEADGVFTVPASSHYLRAVLSGQLLQLDDVSRDVPVFAEHLE